MLLNVIFLLPGLLPAGGWESTIDDEEVNVLMRNETKKYRWTRQEREEEERTVRAQSHNNNNWPDRLDFAARYNLPLLGKKKIQ